MPAKSENRVTIQVPITAKTAELLEEGSRLANNSQSFLAVWAIGCSINDPDEVTKWISRMMKSGIAMNAAAQTPMKESRVRVPLLESDYKKLCDAAAPLGLAPIKLASILLAATLPNTKLMQRFLGTSICAAIRGWLNGSNDLYFQHLRAEGGSEESESRLEAA